MSGHRIADREFLARHQRGGPGLAGEIHVAAAGRGGRTYLKRGGGRANEPAIGDHAQVYDLHLGLGVAVAVLRDVGLVERRTNPPPVERAGRHLAIDLVFLMAVEEIGGAGEGDVFIRNLLTP